MIVRENKPIKQGSAAYEIIRRNALDLYIVTGNASQCYEIYRRSITGGEYKENRGNAASFFKQPQNVDYMEGRQIEIWRDGFEKYARLKDLDVSEFRKTESKYEDIESLTIEQLRNKNLQELEDLKRDTVDESLKVTIIKQISDLMALKMRDKETSNFEDLVHFYLPYKGCNDCPKRPKIKEQDEVD